MLKFSDKNGFKAILIGMNQKTQMFQQLAAYFSGTPSESSVKPRRYGWRPDLPDHRDKYHSFEDPDVPATADLRDTMPTVYDQGELGSCTANAIAGAIQFDELKQGLASETPSRLFIYYNERKLEGTTGSDSGAAIRDGIKTIAKQGYCNETSWPYNIEKFSQKPPSECYTAAKQHVAVEYTRVDQKLTDLQAVLASGYPIVFGISVYSSFEGDTVKDTGLVPMPDKKEDLLGGHAILLVGYDNDKKLFTFRNSWGTTWGKEGYGFLPYDYVLDSNLAEDFWTVKRIS